MIKVINSFLWIYIVVALASAFYLYGIVIEPNGDNIEHLNASWIIWQGNIPYKDFFQHHNPLLWYIFAPFVALLIDNPNIFMIFNIISIAISCLIIFIQAKIFIQNKVGSIPTLFMVAINISSYSIMLASDYRPDLFMHLFIFLGLYFLFEYRDNKRLYNLVYCFLCFFISFMFTQKALFLFVVPGIYILIELVKKKIKINHFLYSLILPFLLFFAFICYLYSVDVLKVYWISNFYFNTFIPEIFYESRVVFPSLEFIEFYIFIPLGLISSIYFIFKKGTYIEKIYSFMFIEESILRLFYFSSFLHYVVLWLMLGTMLTVLFFYKIKKGEIFFCTIGIVYLITILFYSYCMIDKNYIQNKSEIKGHQLAQKILNKCDYAINGYYSVYNLRAKNPGYYAILLGQIDILGEKLGIAPRDNLNKMILEKKPKLISGGVYWDTYWEQRGKKIPTHYAEKEIIMKYYYYSGVSNLFILKPEYQKHKCAYINEQWRYID